MLLVQEPTTTTCAMDSSVDYYRLQYAQDQVSARKQFMEETFDAEISFWQAHIQELEDDLNERRLVLANLQREKLEQQKILQQEEKLRDKAAQKVVLLQTKSFQRQERKEQKQQQRRLHHHHHPDDTDHHHHHHHHKDHGLLDKAKHALLDNFQQEVSHPLSHNNNKSLMVDPITDTPLQLEEDYLRVVQTVRDKLQHHKLEEARATDLAATQLLRTLKSPGRIPATELLLLVLSENDEDPEQPQRYLHQVSTQCTRFVAPHTVPSREEFQATMAYVKDRLPQLDDSCNSFEQTLGLNLYTIFGISDNPLEPDEQDLSPLIHLPLLQEIRAEYINVKDVHLRLVVGQGQDKNKREQDHNNNDDDGEINNNGMTEKDLTRAFAAIEKALYNRMEQRRWEYHVELQRPSNRSASMARYNQQAPRHKNADSPAGDPPSSLQRALSRCELRSQPRQPTNVESSSSSPSCGHDHGGTTKHDRFPYELYGLTMTDSDIDGDLFVSVHGNQGKANHLHTLFTNAHGDPSSSFDHETLTPTKGFSNNKSIHFQTCVADAAHNRLWAATTCNNNASSNGKVHAFSCDQQPTKKEKEEDDDQDEDASLVLAVLKFAEPEIQSLQRYNHASVQLIRCGPCLIGAAETARLNLWNMDQVVEECGLLQEAQAMKDISDHNNHHHHNHQTNNPFLEHGLDPSIYVVEDVAEAKFRTGTIQSISDTHVLVPGVGNGLPVNSSLRLYDIEKGCVSGLLCGVRDYHLAEKQLCVERCHSVFTAEAKDVFAWDLRTYRPSMTLATGMLESTRVLGVPSPSSMVAFAFDRRTECIEVYDLRLPVSHAYTMATANCIVDKLHWHEGTATLLASACSQHQHEGVIYAESNVEMSGAETCFWPKEARHDCDYFGSKWTARHDCGYYGGAGTALR